MYKYCFVSELASWCLEILLVGGELSEARLARIQFLRGLEYPGSHTRGPENHSISLCPSFLDLRVGLATYTSSKPS